MDTIKLTLKKKWFDMILSGQKTEEYRELKQFWNTRLSRLYPYKTEKETYYPTVETIQFFNGHCFFKKYPNFIIEFKEAEISTGKPEWGAKDGEKYHVIRLGRVLSSSNCCNG